MFREEPEELLSSTAAQCHSILVSWGAASLAQRLNLSMLLLLQLQITADTCAAAASADTANTTDTITTTNVAHYNVIPPFCCFFFFLRDVKKIQPQVQLHANDCSRSKIRCWHTIFTF